MGNNASNTNAFQQQSSTTNMAELNSIIEKGKSNEW